MQLYKTKLADDCALGFDKSSIKKHRGLGNYHPANSNVVALRFLANNSTVINGIKKYLPKLKKIETEWHTNNKPKKTSGHTSDTPNFAILNFNHATLGVGITADVRNTTAFNADDNGNIIDPTIIVEGTVIDILISVYNGTSETISGLLHPTMIDSSGTATALQTLKINNLESFSLFQVSLLATAPMAGLGNLFVVELNNDLFVVEVNNDQSDVLAKCETTFYTAALFTYTIDWVHIIETRSLRSDTLYFASTYSPHTSIPGGYLQLGDHMNGDQLPLNVNYAFALYPTSESVQTYSFAMLNYGERNLDAVNQSAYFSFLFDIISAAFFVGIDKSHQDYIDGLRSYYANHPDLMSMPADDNPFVGLPATFNVSTIIWYEAIKTALELDCNGIVIADGVIMRGSDIVFSLNKDERFVHTHTYQGSDSNNLCGPNSRYTLQTTTKRIS